MASYNRSLETIVAMSAGAFLITACDPEYTLSGNGNETVIYVTPIPSQDNSPTPTGAVLRQSKR